MSLHTYLGPWRPGGVELGWVGPEGAVAAADLRPAEAQGRPDGTPGIGMFVTDRRLGSEYDLLATGHPQEARVTGRGRSAWNRLVGSKGVQGETPAELLWHQLTWGADPTGADCPKPLLPGREGGASWFRLHLLGPAHGRPFAWGEDAEATSRVKAVLQADFARMAEDADQGRMRDARGRVDRQQHLRVLDYLQHEFRTDWREFVPQRLRGDIPGPKPHATAYPDDFNRTDNTTLGSPWEEIVTDLAIRSNRFATASGNTSDNPRARYNADLSSGNHYVQITAASEGSSGSFPQNVYFGALARYASAADTCYVGWQRRSTSTSRVLQKVVTGTFTTLLSDNTSATVPYAVKVEINGSALKLYIAGVQVLSTTDTAITGNLRGGALLRGGGDAIISGNQALDDWLAEDLALTTIAATRLRSRMNGDWSGVLTVVHQ